VFSFTGGANNFPLVPAAHIVFYLVTVFVTVPRLLADAASPARPEGAVLFGLAAISVVMIAGALSRADPRVLFFGLGVTLLFFVLAAHRSRRVFALAAAAYAVIVIGGLHVSNARSFYGASLESLRPSHILAFARSRGEAPLTDAELGHFALLPLPGAAVLLVRSGPANHGLSVVASAFRAGVLLRDHRRVLGGAVGQGQRHASPPYLLVRKGWLASRNVCRPYLDIIRSSFIYDAWLPCRREALETEVVVNRAIAEHYRVVEEVGPYVIMKRTTSPSAS